ncbi:MAG: hypothetical protein PUI24_09145 [Spirochaetales bacterium]|nr:hypothetical protein [Spirochaetales bacterium]
MPESKGKNPFAGQTFYESGSKFEIGEKTITVSEKVEERDTSYVPSCVYEYTLNAEDKILSYKIVKLSLETKDCLLTYVEAYEYINSGKFKKDMLAKVKEELQQEVENDELPQELFETALMLAEAQIPSNEEFLTILKNTFSAVNSYSYNYDGTNLNLTELFNAETAVFEGVETNVSCEVCPSALNAEIMLSIDESTLYFEALSFDNGTITFVNVIDEEDPFVATYTINEKSKTLTLSFTYNKTEYSETLNFVPNEMTLSPTEGD